MNDGAAGEPDAVLRSFEALPALVWLFDGPDLVIVAANRAARSRVGERGGLIGRPVGEALPELAGQGILDLLRQCHDHGETIAGHARRVLVARDGDLGEGFFTFTCTPLDGPRGRQVLAHVVEVTDQVAAQGRESAPHGVGVLDLQRSLLPDGLPVLPTVDLAARYLVAADALSAGGDWFDAVVTGPLVTLAVGDVVGHGAQAAATMGRLRTLCAHALADGLDAAVAALDGFAEATPVARGSTVCLVELDTRDGAVRLVSRGHVPPLVLAPSGATRFLPAGGAPLGAGGGVVPVRVDQLDPGETLLLFTDGLVERHDRPLGERLALLAQVTSAAVAENAGVDRLGLLAVERMGWLGFRDDVTVLLARREAVPLPAIDITLPAEPAAPGRLRHACEDWLDALRADEDTRFRVQHAVTEAVTNAVEHAYPDGRGDVRLTAALSPTGTVELVVADQGRWRPAGADPGPRGRGVGLIRALTDSCDVERSEHGTAVRMAVRVFRRPVLGGGPEGGPHPGPAFHTEIHRSSTPALVVVGPVDTTTVQRLSQAILDGSRGGALPLTVDLSGVTHLASAGVSLLHGFAGSLDLRLVAAAGTPAGDILALTGLRERFSGR